MLNNTPPSLYLMFTNQVKEFKYGVLPGYISVPYQFDVHELKKYMAVHAVEARLAARKFVDE